MLKNALNISQCVEILFHEFLKIIDEIILSIQNGSIPN
jgi:hypothetical protein